MWSVPLNTASVRFGRFGVHKRMFRWLFTWKGIKKILYLGSIFFIWDQKKNLVPDSKNRLFLYIFAFMDGWFGIFRASALGSLQPPKPYGSCHLATRRRPNLTHSMIWRPRGTQILRKLSFGDREAPKPYAHYDLETQRHPNLTEAVFWRLRTAQTLCSLYFAYLKHQNLFFNRE